MQTHSMSKSLKAQSIIGILAIIGFSTQGSWDSALYGFLIGIANVVMLGITFKKANNKAAEDPKQGMLVLYLSAVIRFILLAVLFVLGLSLFQFEPMPVVLTFVLMQIGQMFNLTGKRRLTD